MPHDLATGLTASQTGITASRTVSVLVVCPDRWFSGDAAVVTSRDGRTFAGEAAGLDVCTGQVAITLPGRASCPPCAPPAARARARVLSRHRPGPPAAGTAGWTRPGHPAPHQAINTRGMMIMNAQILPAGTDRDYAAALDWITHTAAGGTMLPSPEDDGPATEDLVAALLPAIASEHATAIVAQQIRQTLSAPWPGPAYSAAPAGHGTFRHAGTVITASEICTGCGRYYDLPADADQVIPVAGQQDGTGMVLVQCKDTGACYERWRSMVTCF